MYAEVENIEEIEEEASIFFAPGPMSPNQNLESSQSDTVSASVSPSVSITSVDGSQASGSGESNNGLDTGLFGLRSVQGTTNLIPPASVTSTPSPSTSLPPWHVLQRRLSSNRSRLSMPEESQLYDNTITLLEALGNHLSTRETREINRRFSELVLDPNGSTPTDESVQRRRRRTRAEAIARARRMRARSLAEAGVRDEERVPPCSFAQVLRRGNSVSDCSQCSSDDEQNRIKVKNRRPTVPSHLSEWLYPI